MLVLKNAGDMGPQYAELLVNNSVDCARFDVNGNRVAPEAGLVVEVDVKRCQCLGTVLNRDQVESLVTQLQNWLHTTPAPKRTVINMVEGSV